MEYMYKIGDVVRIREDLVGGEHYRMESGRTVGFETYFNHEMKIHCGKVATIVGVSSSGYTIGGIAKWVFSDGMIEPADLMPQVEVNERELFSLICGGA